jgi:hypothetical protein
VRLVLQIRHGPPPRVCHRAALGHRCARGRLEPAQRRSRPSRPRVGVDPRDEAVEVDAFGDCVDVDGRDQTVEVEACGGVVGIDTADDRVHVDPRHDGVQIHPRYRGIQVNPGDNGVDVELRSQRVDVDVLAYEHGEVGRGEECVDHLSHDHREHRTRTSFESGTSPLPAFGER